MNTREVEATMDTLTQRLTDDGFVAGPGDDVTSHHPTGTTRSVRLQNAWGTFVTVTVSTV